MRFIATKKNKITAVKGLLLLLPKAFLPIFHFSLLTGGARMFLAPGRRVPQLRRCSEGIVNFGDHLVFRYFLPKPFLFAVLVNKSLNLIEILKCQVLKFIEASCDFLKLFQIPIILSFLCTIYWILVVRFLYTFSKYDVISSVWKRYCVLGLGLRLRLAEIHFRANVVDFSDNNIF